MITVMTETPSGMDKSFLVYRNIHVKGIYSYISFSAEPFISGVIHSFGFTVLEPGHEGPVKFEMASAFSLEEAPDVLGIPVGRGDRRCPRELVIVPVEFCHALTCHNLANSPELETPSNRDF
jgi:hypothetical protein